MSATSMTPLPKPVMGRRSSLNPNAAVFTLTNDAHVASPPQPHYTLQHLLTPTPPRAIARIEYVTVPVIHYEPYSATTYNYYTQPYVYSGHATTLGATDGFPVIDSGSGSQHYPPPLPPSSHPMTVPSKTRRLRANVNTDPNNDSGNKGVIWQSRSRRPSDYFGQALSQSLPAQSPPQSQSSQIPASRYYQRRSSYDSQAVARYVARTAPVTRIRYTRDTLLSLRSRPDTSIELPNNLPSILRADGIELKDSGRSLFTRASSAEEGKTHPVVSISLPPTPVAAVCTPLSASSIPSSPAMPGRPSLRLQLTPAAEMKKSITSILNRLAPDKADRLVLQAASLDIVSEELLTVIVNTIFDKSINEPAFAAMYAAFLAELAPHLPVFHSASDRSDCVNGKALLLRKATSALANENEQSSSPVSATQSTESMDGGEAAIISRLAPRRRAVLAMIGELFKHDLLTPAIVHTALDSLVDAHTINEIDDSEIEALASLLFIVGAKLDHPTDREENSEINSTSNTNGDVGTSENPKVTSYFRSLTALLNRASPLSGRLRFKLLDLIELRSNHWQSKRKKSIDTSRLKLIEAEFNKQQEREKAARSKNERKSSTPTSPATQLRWVPTGQSSSLSTTSTSTAKTRKESVRFSDSLSYHRLGEDSGRAEEGKEQEIITNSSYSSGNSSQSPFTSPSKHHQLRGILKNSRSSSVNSSPNVKWRRKEAPIVSHDMPPSPLVVTTQPPSQASSSSSLSSLSLNRRRPSPLKPRLTRENLKQLTREIVDEFFVSRDLDEACLCLQELNEKAVNEGLVSADDSDPLQSPLLGMLKSPTLSPSTLSASASIVMAEIAYDSLQPTHVIVLMTIIYAISNVTDAQRSSLTAASTLLRGLVRRKSISHTQLISGWRGCMERLEDLIVDCPKAVNYISELLAAALLDHCITVKQAIALIDCTRHQSISVTPFQFLVSVLTFMRDMLERQHRSSLKGKDAVTASGFVDSHQHDAFVLAFKMAKGAAAIDELIQLYQHSQLSAAEQQSVQSNAASAWPLTLESEQKIDSALSTINAAHATHADQSIHLTTSSAIDSERDSLTGEICSSLQSSGLECLVPLLQQANFSHWKL